MATKQGDRPEDRKAVIIYDGMCVFCASTVNWIRQNDSAGAFEMLPCQSDVLETEFPGIDRTACMDALQLVMPDGRVFAGEKALPKILTILKRHRGAAALLRLPGTEGVWRAAYRWFAGHRYDIARLLHLRKPDDRNAWRGR
jgi:predicted DCC family thiol-disulfide oxidoreductase YuxK